MASRKVEILKERISGASQPDDIFLEIMELFNDLEMIPEVGKYYTFIYQPKTPHIRYDEFPLIACVDVFPWGFRGVNFHWEDYRNYTWMEVAGQLRVISDEDIDGMKDIPYAKFLLNREK